jgi:hypothetical protein
MLQPLLPVVRDQPAFADSIDIGRKRERDEIGFEAVDRRARLFAGTAVRLLDRDVVAGLGFPLAREGGVEVLVQLVRRSVRLGQDQQPAAQKQNFDMARFDAGIAFDDRIDRVEALAEVTGYQNFAAAEAQHERSGSVFHAKRAVQGGHDDFLIVVLVQRFQNSITTV